MVSNLFFWRDNIGNEIDVVVEQGEKLTPIELKSGQTLSGDSFKEIIKWGQIAGPSSGTPHLVYGGKENQNRSGTQVLSWKNIPALAETI